MASERLDLRRRLFALAAEQGGYFTAAQAKELGYSYQAQAYHVGAGNWLRVGRGMLRLGEWVPEVHDELIRWSVWTGGRGVVSHRSALSVHGIGEYESPGVDITVPAGFAGRAPGVRLFVGELPDGDVLDRSGFRVTTVIRSLIDVASIEPDTGQLARAVDEAIASGAVTARMLRTRSEAVDLRAALAIERALGVLGAT